MAAIQLFLTNTATSSPAPTTSFELSTSANASEQQINPGEHDNTLPGNTHAGQWLPADNIAATTAAAEITNTAGTTTPVRGSTAPSQTASPTSPAGTEIGDLVIVFTWTQGTTGVPTHTLQSGFTLLRDHSHDDGSTDGRASVAYKIATSAGAETYGAFTSSGTPWSGILVVKKTEFSAAALAEFARLWRTSAVNSVTSTGTGASNPAAVTLTSGFHAHLVLSFVAYHIATATVAIGPPTSYAEEWEVAGSATTEMELASRVLVGRAGQSEDPAAVTDDVTPNGTCSITIALPLEPSIQALTSVKAFLYNGDLSGQTIALANWASQLRLEATQGTGSAGRTCIRASIVEKNSGAWVYKDVLTGPTQLTGAAVGSLVLGHVGWRDQNEARHTVTSTPTNFSSTYSAIKQRKLASGEFLLIELGFCDADSATDRTWRLLFNTSNSYITTPFIGVAPEVSDVYPPSGHIYGGKLIELTGTGFAAGDTVSIDGRACTDVTIHSSTRITCRTPRGIRLGARAVKVTSTDGLYGELVSGFTFQHPLYDVLTTRWVRLFLTAISTGGTLTWYDALDNGDVTQSTAANLPTVSSIAASGQTTVVFDGTASPNQKFCTITTALPWLKDWASSDHALRISGISLDAVPTQPAVPLSMNSGGGINEDCQQFSNAGGNSVFYSGGTAKANNTPAATDSVLRRYVEYANGTTTTVYVANTAQTTTDASPTLGTNWRTAGIEYGYQPVSPDRRLDGFWSISGFAYSTSSFASDLAALETAFAEAHDGYGSPTCSACTPNTGAPGDLVELTGTNFEDGLTVRFGTSGNFSDEVFVVSKTQAFAVVPAGSGQVNVVVANPVAGNSGSLTNGFTYDAAAPTGTGSMVVAPPVAAASGTERMSGTGAEVVTPPVVAASGTERMRGTADMVVGPAVYVAVGAEAMRAMGVLVAAPPTTSASAAERMSGSCSMLLPGVVCAATGWGEVTGDGAMAVTPPAIAGTAQVRFSGVASPVVTPPAIAAAGTERHAGTAAQAVAPPAVAANAIERFSGSASLSISVPLCAASSVEAFQGSCALVLTTCAFSAAGTVDGGGGIVGSSAMVVTPPSVGASATERASGAAVLVVAPPTVSTVGLERCVGGASLVVTAVVTASGAHGAPDVSGAASLLVTPPIVTASGALRVSGGVSLLVIPPSLSGVGAFRYVGAGLLVPGAPIVAASGTAIVDITGTASLTPSPPALSASGRLAFRGTAFVQVGPPQFATVGLFGTRSDAHVSWSLRPATTIYVSFAPSAIVRILQQRTATRITWSIAMAEPVHVNDVLEIDFEFRNGRTLELVDPSSAQLKLQKRATPTTAAGELVIYTYGVGTVISKIAVGQYRASIVCTAEGWWDFVPFSPGPTAQGSKPGEFYVKATI